MEGRGKGHRKVATHERRSLLLDAVRIHESEEKEGGTQTREQWSPSARARFADSTSRERNVIASVGEVAMFFAISDFTAVNRAALFAARVAVGAAVRQQ